MNAKLKLFAFIMFALAAALRLEAQTPPQFLTIHSFNGSAGDGAFPVGNLVQDPAGNIFGVTQNGGTSNADNGTFFALFPAGGNSYNYTNLYNFTGGTNGGHPIGDLTLRINGQAGTLAKLPVNVKPQVDPSPSETITEQNATGGATGHGTIIFWNAFEAIAYVISNIPDPTHTQSVAHVEGKTTKPAVVASGNMVYGVNVDSIGDGAVYSINTNGTGYKVLQYFGNSQSTNGFYPNYSLTLSGNTLYGTAREGGTGGGLGNGTVFSVNTGGSNYTVLHTFTNGADGSQPRGGVLLSGNTLYGTTFHGGTNYNGTVFKMNTNGGNYQVIEAFGGHYGQGGEPEGDLVLSGNTLYGTASVGGAFGGGSVYSINTDGSHYAALYDFYYLIFTIDGVNTHTNSDGFSPTAGLLLSGNTLLGTTSTGGIYGDGTVFEIVLPSPPAPPSLNIAPSGGNFSVSWPSSATNYMLQSNSALNSLTWSNFTGGYKDDGTNKSVSIIPAAGNAFFRLLNTNGP